MGGSTRGLISLLASVGLLASTPALAAPEVQRPAASPADKDDSDPSEVPGSDAEAAGDTGAEGPSEAGVGELDEAGEGESEAKPEATPLPDVEPDEPGPDERVVVTPAPAIDETADEAVADLDHDDGDLDFDDGDGFDDGYDPLRDSPEALTARRWLGAGIGATLTGAALVGGALAMGLGDPCAPSSGNNCFADAADRAALSMGAPGGLLLLGGAAMIAVGVVQKRRLAASLSVSADQIGAVIVGRF